jgi:hypothetical protein
MKASSISTIRETLQNLPNGALIEICHKLMKFRKENKELLHYLLFESNDEVNFINNLKEEVDELFCSVNTQTIFFAKKTIRKILREITKHCKFSGRPSTQIEVLLHFCKRMYALPLHWQDSKVMVNLYQTQVNKIEKLLLTVHEDLQYDYRQQIDELPAVGNC